MSKSTLVLITFAALGLGALVGLSLVDTDRSAVTEGPTGVAATVATGGAPAFRYISPDDVPVEWAGANPGVPFTVRENFIARDKDWKSETLTIELAGDIRVEYKIFMSQGDAVVFSWSVSGEELYFDFFIAESFNRVILFQHFLSKRSVNFMIYRFQLFNFFQNFRLCLLSTFNFFCDNWSIYKFLIQNTDFQGQHGLQFLIFFGRFDNLVVTFRDLF